MHTSLLVDAIMRQTTVLIAQLSATAGVRAPLAHLADEVFLSLSRELEDQGLSRKVVADMFGMALRSYQRRVQRISESVTEGGRTLWQAVYEYLQQQGQATRIAVFNRFLRDDPEAIAAVLADLVRSGLASRTGSGAATLFAVTPEEARRLLARQGKEDTATAIVWIDVCRHPGTSVGQIAGRLGLDEEQVDSAVCRLERDGRLTRGDQGQLEAEQAMVIPVGSEAGWEAAVFDHFQAVVGAITAKLRLGANSASSDTTGGTTLSFEIRAGHPLANEVRQLLAKFRHETDELWDRVEAENAKHPISEEEMQRVIFYFGQLVKGGEDEG